MNTENQTPPGAGGEVLPPADVITAKPPTNDAQAAAQEEADKAAKPPEAGTDQNKKPNRTREYIDRINEQNRQLREREESLRTRLETLEKRLPAPTVTAPKPEDFYSNPQAYTDAITRQRVDEARQQWEAGQRQQAEAQQQQQSLETYNQRATQFAEKTPDFQEAVGSIDPRLLPRELQAAILAQENGPEIAYHLANNDEELWQLNALRADLLPLAVLRLASRLKATQEVGGAPTPSIPAVPALAGRSEPKPVSQTPPPAPRVAGTSPTEIPPEKLTDDQWFAREKERNRKR